MSTQQTIEKHAENPFNTTFSDKEGMEEAYESLIQKIVSEIKNGSKTDSFKKTVDCLSITGSYSARNKALIYMQKPDVVGPFNGYKQWKQFGRVPEKGSSAIWILAPINIKYCNESNEPVKYCEKCDTCTESHYRMVGTRSVKTFAYSQTVELADEDKPENVKDISIVTEKNISTEKEKEKIQNAYNKLINFAEEQGMEVTEISDISEWSISKSRGSYNPQTNKIKIRNFKIGNDAEKIPVESRFSTLVHEIAHGLLHNNMEKNLSKKQKELEAESVAYGVCKWFGIETESGVYISTFFKNELESNESEEYIKERVENSIERIAETISNIQMKLI